MSSNLGNKTIFAENFKYYLQKNNEKQVDISKLLNVTQATVNDWIKMRTYPRMDKIQMLAEHWGIDMTALVEKQTIREFIDKEKRNLVNEMLNDNDSIKLFTKIKKLSPRNREIVESLISSLTREE